MNCIKNKKRNLHNLFDIISCQECINYKDDEVIYIGMQVIRILPITKGCKSMEFDIISECFNERLSRMLIEMSEYEKYNDDYIFMWVSSPVNDFIYNLGLFEAFIAQGLNFCLIY